MRQKGEHNDENETYPAFVVFYSGGHRAGRHAGQRVPQRAVLSWLSYYQSIGFNSDAPFVLDLSVVKLTFGFSMGVSVAQIFTIAAAIFLYNRTSLR